MSLTLRVIAHSGMRRYPLPRFRSPQSQSDFTRSAPGAVELAARRYLDGPCAVDAFVSVEGVSRVIRINQGHEVAVGVARVFDRLAAMEIVVDGVLAASSVLALQQRRTSSARKGSCYAGGPNFRHTSGSLNAHEGATF